MKTVIIFAFVFIVMMTVIAILLGGFGATPLFAALGIDWTLRLVAAIIVSAFIAGWLS